MITSKIQLVKTLKEQLSSKIDRAIHGLMVLYDFQTTDEQSIKRTKHQNGVGFSAYDSEFLSSLAQQYKERKSLSSSQQRALMRIMPKYAAQLIEYSLSLGKIRKENGRYVW